MRAARRGVWFVYLTILLCALLGGIYGRRVEATTDAIEDNDVQASLNAFTHLYDTVERNYADKVDADKAIFSGAIPSMLRTLDPHSNFFDARTFAALREEQEGKYYGVGMQVSPRGGKTIVLAPFPGSPAHRAGLRPGDVIIKVDDKSTENLTTTQVADLLKGPKGTVVHVFVTREGSPEPLEFTIVRAEIPRFSVDKTFFLRPGIGYIHLANFTENTNTELTRALKKLDEKTLQGLILDLRNNPGGLLPEAVEVSDHFLQKNQLIVYHYGRNSREKRYYASKGDGGHDYPIIVLINRYTASAAEIVAGALQDHDRALVIGESSFGKGLVQTVYPLSERTGLALTTARYYTPSGRLIQRDYAHVSLYDYYFNLEKEVTPKEGEPRLTDGGREVFGGGGINPDVKATEPKPTSFQDLLLRKDAFFNFAKRYLGVHRVVTRDFEVNDQVLKEFAQFLDSEKIRFTPADLQENLSFIRPRIKAQLFTSFFDSTEGDRVELENDFVVQKALELLPQARELTARARKYMASKQSR